MAINYEGFAIPKPRPFKAEKDARKAKLATTDALENAKARIRANGRCEVYDVSGAGDGRYSGRRCVRVDSQTHHLIGGIGRRNKGKSILAEYKLRVCSRHHQEITGKTLVPTTAEHTAYTVRYRRQK